MPGPPAANFHFPILQTITVEEGRITEVRTFYWDTAEVANACTSGAVTTGALWG